MLARQGEEVVQPLLNPPIIFYTVRSDAAIRSTINSAETSLKDTKRHQASLLESSL